MIKKQYTVYLENKPGAIARITGLLAKAGVNIEGISVSETTDVGLVQIVPGSAAKTGKILKAAKVPFSVQDVALVKLENRAGALAEVVGRLAKGGVNINYVYATGCACRACACQAYAVISAPDLHAIEALWNDAE